MQVGLNLDIDLFLLFIKMKDKIRCGWVKLMNPLYVRYHDEEWGKPIFNDQRHFEYLMLETFQAGLSWETVLNKRAAYQQAMWQFNPIKISKASFKDVNRWMVNNSLIRHRGKFTAAISNANVFLDIQKEFQSFHQFLLTYFPNGKIVNHPITLKDLPSESLVSIAISKALKKRGMKFVGPKIIYAHLQAIGLIDDHLETCFCKTKS